MNIQYLSRTFAWQTHTVVWEEGSASQGQKNQGVRCTDSAGASHLIQRGEDCNLKGQPVNHCDVFNFKLQFGYYVDSKGSTWNASLLIIPATFCGSGFWGVAKFAFLAGNDTAWGRYGSTRISRAAAILVRSPLFAIDALLFAMKSRCFVSLSPFCLYLSLVDNPAWLSYSRYLFL